MSEFRKIMSSIENEEYSPFYLLHGDEPYFIDKIESKITDNLIDDSSRHSIIHYSMEKMLMLLIL